MRRAAARSTRQTCFTSAPSAGADKARGRGARAHRPPHLSPLACQALVGAIVQPQAALGRASGSTTPALLLLPPWLVAHALDLARQALEAAVLPPQQHVLPSGGGASASDQSCSWQADMAARVFALYSSCYHAAWGARVLQGETLSKQLLAAAQRLRALLQASVSGACGGGAPPDDAGAEAAALGQLAGKRGRRTAGHAAAPAPAKRAKQQAGAARPAGNGEPAQSGAVAELLQLFQPDAPGSSQEEGTQQAIDPLPAPAGGKPARRRIVPQLVAAQAPAAKPTSPPTALQSTTQPLKGASAGVDHAASAGAGERADDDSEPLAPRQRVMIVKSAGMTGERARWAGAGWRAWQCERAQSVSSKHGCALVPCDADEEQEAAWSAYIADKELLVEMLGVRACTALRGVRHQGVVGDAQLLTVRGLLPAARAGQRVPAVARRGGASAAAGAARRARQPPGGVGGIAGPQQWQQPAGARAAAHAARNEQLSAVGGRCRCGNAAAPPAPAVRQGRQRAAREQQRQRHPAAAAAAAPVRAAALRVPCRRACCSRAHRHSRAALHLLSRPARSDAAARRSPRRRRAVVVGRAAVRAGGGAGWVCGWRAAHLDGV